MVLCSLFQRIPPKVHCIVMDTKSLLVLDGGGMRGVMEAMMLMDLMLILSKLVREKDVLLQKLKRYLI